MRKLILGAIAIVGLNSCTGNNFARNFGGTTSINLDANERLVNITWKDNDLWVLTKTDPTIKPTMYSFKEKSSYGILNGEIIITEK